MHSFFKKGGFYHLTGYIRFIKFSDLNQTIIKDYDLKLHITRTTKKVSTEDLFMFPNYLQAKSLEM